jgi:hypothetical protein
MTKERMSFGKYLAALLMVLLVDSGAPMTGMDQGQQFTGPVYLADVKGARREQVQGSDQGSGRLLRSAEFLLEHTITSISSLFRATTSMIDSGSGGSSPRSLRTLLATPDSSVHDVTALAQGEFTTVSIKGTRPNISHAAAIAQEDGHYDAADQSREAVLKTDSIKMQAKVLYQQFSSSSSSPPMQQFLATA